MIIDGLREDLDVVDVNTHQRQPIEDLVHRF